jgi:hypothetical protein
VKLRFHRSARKSIDRQVTTSFRQQLPSVPSNNRRCRYEGKAGRSFQACRYANLELLHYITNRSHSLISSTNLYLDFICTFHRLTDSITDELHDISPLLPKTGCIYHSSSRRRRTLHRLASILTRRNDEPQSGDSSRSEDLRSHHAGTSRSLPRPSRPNTTQQRPCSPVEN